MNLPVRGEPIDDIDHNEAAEIDDLAKWLYGYFGRVGEKNWKERIVVPTFKGHGIIAPCSGDFEVDNNLIEMKYVDRGFRSHDLRQVIAVNISP